MYHIGEFTKGISECRTFVFLHELEQLLHHNLIKGGDLDNAIVIVDREIEQEKLDHLAKIFNKPTVKVQGKGVLNNTTLHHQNEPARHKLLDIVGDLALVGMPIKGHILAARPGHAANVAFAKMIKELAIARKKKKETTVYFDLNAAPLLNIQDIMKLLPHRQPFLLVDKIMELSSTHVVGVKNVTMNEYFFQGHFPGEPVMPGVLQVEALAQTGGILAINSLPPGEYDTYFVKIDNCKFKHKVVPGDTLIMKLELTGPIRRGMCEMIGTVYVGNKITTETMLMAQLVKREGT
jgi:UDP-3-O-[3-hydroxymyristoyl] N-acetylglucosamine deacetylase/3-hydroxyacyl-[acyl-carrier-protein] dehydratase